MKRRWGSLEIYQAVVKRKERLEIPAECPDTSLAELMAWCWDADHRQRPDMKEVHQFLVEFDATDASNYPNVTKQNNRCITPLSTGQHQQQDADSAGHREHEKREILGMLELSSQECGESSTGLTGLHHLHVHTSRGRYQRRSKVKVLLTGVINGIKKTVKNHFEDFEYVSFWLTNTIRLMHTLKQYSGEDKFASQNTHRQNEHCLRNFDLSEYRQVMNDLGVHIYQMLVHIIENKLQPMIVPAMLTPLGLMRGHITIESLIKQLTTFLTVMNNHGTDPEVVKQAIKQSFYLVTASTINIILLRKDMCHWSKGVQIRYNMSELEEWLRSSRLYDRNMEETLEPLVQIAQLLQVKKRTEDDVRLICETCTKLTTTQVVKILNLYTPDKYEEKTEVSFIRKVQGKLAGRMTPKKDAQLLLDTKYMFPVTFPFNPSSVLLNEITIPDTFKLDCVKRV
ncbi:unconventional myosin-Va-like [Patiria miniata]|uniref:Dilute domain-containing protein n=1 Tax=Patiria miniata TaxID=46514 RepID=A0A914A4D3_PATMI|nr:unconventional myosin-Va-like [Patiria miniata]